MSRPHVQAPLPGGLDVRRWRHVGTASYDPGTPCVVTPAMDDFGTFNRGGVITSGIAILADGNTWCFIGCAMRRVWQVGAQPINQVIFHGDTADEVSVGGAPVVGERYETFELNFTGKRLFSFVQSGADTDPIPPGALIKPAGPTPVPASPALMGLRRRSRHINPGETA